MRFMGLSALGLTLALARPAIAQKAEAAAAFERGKTLIAQGQVAEGCAELETSMRLEPLMGTLYNLALCHEQLGKIASAWTEFKEVAAADKNAARAKDATRRAAALEKKLTRMRIVVATPVEGLVVKRDAVDVTALVDRDVPVDPARYTFIASAPGHADASIEIDLSTPSATIEVTIPPLVKSREITPTPTVATDPYADRKTLRPVVLPRKVLEASVRSVWESSLAFEQDPLDTFIGARMGLGPIEAHASITLHTSYNRTTYRPVLTRNITLGADYILTPLLAAGAEVIKFHPLGGVVDQGTDFRADLTAKKIISPTVALVGSGGIGYQTRQTRGQDRAASELALVGDGAVQLAPIRRLTLEGLTRLRVNLSGDLYGEYVLIDIGAAATAQLTRALDAYIETMLVVVPTASDLRIVTAGVVYRHP